MSIRFYESIRTADANLAVAGETTGTMTSLVGRKYALIVTYRKSGEPVPTPVWFGLNDGRLYFRSVSTGRKLDRIANNPEVLVAPSAANGRPIGPCVRAVARLLTSPEDEARAEAAIRGNYGLSRRVYARLIAPRVPGRYVEVSPAASSEHQF